MKPKAVTTPKIVEKPWGREIWYAHNQHYAGKVVELRAGHRASLHLHRLKHETLYLLAGRVNVTCGDEQFLLAPGQAVTVPPQTVHRLQALEDSVVLEASSPELDDVVRLQDDYARAETKLGK
ncbi:MAG: cupin domain-containing protein [Deinococcus sp.]|nr:cupin domain-containing protein [Deinococcus sp.]